MVNILGITRAELSLWKSPSFIIDVIFSLCIFNFALLINYYAVRIATDNASSAINDIILKLVTKQDTSFIHGELSQWLKWMAFSIMILRPKFLNFALKALALTIITRAIFVNLTNLGIPPESVPIHSFYTYGGDLFFSGHVALPFMLALVFWEVPFIRWLFIIKSILLGSEALIGHYHYSIDVFAAPFIVYGLYTIAKKLFKEDFEMMSKNVG